MPLCGKLGILCGQIVLCGMYFPVGTHRTAASRCPGFDLRLPLVSLFAFPPDLPMTAGQYLCRGEITVSRWMPLAGQFRKNGGQIVLSRLCNFTGTDRAAGSAAGGVLMVLQKPLPFTRGPGRSGPHPPGWAAGGCPRCRSPSGPPPPWREWPPRTPAGCRCRYPAWRCACPFPSS